MTLGGGDDQADPPIGETKKWGLGVSEKRERGGRACAAGLRPAAWAGRGSWAAGYCGPLRGGFGPSGQEDGEEGFCLFIFFFPFLLFQSHFQNSFKNCFELCLKYF